MSGIRVVTDTACDLPDDIVESLNLRLVPLRIRFGDEEMIDRFELSTDQFWARCAAFDGMPSTAAPSPGQFQVAFEAARDEGRGRCRLCQPLVAALGDHRGGPPGRTSPGRRLPGPGGRFVERRAWGRD